MKPETVTAGRVSYPDALLDEKCSGWLDFFDQSLLTAGFPDRDSGAGSHID
jgi:hypothetical protein